MIHTIKNYKWIIATSLICIVFGLLTFFTFTNQSFITLKDFNLQMLLIIDLILLVVFFGLIIIESYKILSRRKRKKLGSEVNLKYILYFSSTTLLPSIIIAIYSLILFNIHHLHLSGRESGVMVFGMEQAFRSFLCFFEFLLTLWP